MPLAGFDTTGCWVRTISDVKKEIENLAKRHDLAAEEMHGHDDQTRAAYTNYSPCTYIKKDLPVFLFGGGVSDKNFGVFISSGDEKIDWWYRGETEYLTDKLRFQEGEKIDLGVEGQFWNCTLKEIQQAVIELKDEYSADPYYQENPDESVTLKWNEGLLRYQRKDIIGLLVDESLQESVFNALIFRKALGLNIHLYSYNEGEVEQLSSSDINKHSHSFSNAVKEHKANFEKICLDTQKAIDAESSQAPRPNRM